MAAIGFFTYHDLYGGRPDHYHHQTNSQSSSSSTTQLVPISNTTVASFSTTTDLVELISSTTIQPDSKLYKLAQFIPFAYFHWFLIGLAFLLALLLTIIFTYYCRGCCRKRNKTRKEKKQPLPNFYRYRTANRRAQSNSIHDSTAPFLFPSPKRPCPSKSMDSRNSQLLRQGLDAVGSPQLSRFDVSQIGPSSSFSCTASDLLTEIKGRFSTHSSKPSLKTQQFFETQRANMALNDESKNSSLLIDMK